MRCARNQEAIGQYNDMPALCYFSHFPIDDLLRLLYPKSFVFIDLGVYAEWPINPGDGQVNAGVGKWRSPGWGGVNLYCTPKVRQ
jgi:hypothetical protein